MEIREILCTLDQAACNLEETCFGIRHIHKLDENKDRRELLIKEIETELETFTEAFRELKAFHRLQKKHKNNG